MSGPQTSTAGPKEHPMNAPAGGTPAEAAAFVRAERAKWGQVIREAGIKLN